MQDFERTPQPHDVRMQGSVRVEFALEHANRTGLLSKPFPLPFHPGSQIWAHAPLGDAGVLLWVRKAGKSLSQTSRVTEGFCLLVPQAWRLR